MFMGSIFFNASDGSPASLVFQPVHKYVKIITNTKCISEWKSKVLSDKNIKLFLTTNNSLTPVIDYYDYNIRVKFNGSILRKPKVLYAHKKQ